MTKWAYCTISEPLAEDQRPTVTFWGSSAEKTEGGIREIDHVGYELARLGEEGWELVSHTVLFGTTEKRSQKSFRGTVTTAPRPMVFAVPTEQVFFLKKKVE